MHMCDGNIVCQRECGFAQATSQGSCSRTERNGNNHLVGVVYLGGNHITINQFRRLRACQDDQEKFQIKRNEKLDVRAHVGRGVPRALETKKVCAE